MTRSGRSLPSLLKSPSIYFWDRVCLFFDSCLYNIMSNIKILKIDRCEKKEERDWAASLPVDFSFVRLKKKCAVRCKRIHRGGPRRTCQRRSQSRDPSASMLRDTTSRTLSHKDATDHLRFICCYHARLDKHPRSSNLA